MLVKQGVGLALGLRLGLEVPLPFDQRIGNVPSDKKEQISGCFFACDQHTNHTRTSPCFLPSLSPILYGQCCFSQRHNGPMRSQVKDFREKKKIYINVEHRHINSMTVQNDAENLPLIKKVELFENAMNNTTGQDLYKVCALGAADHSSLPDTL